MYYLLILFYLVGAFPTGYLMAKAKGIELSDIGSGNVGATNVARALGKTAGIATLVIDIFKGIIPVLIACYISDDAMFIYLSGLMPVLGHCFSIPKLLKGGKGVATGLGAALCLAPIASLLSLVVFGIVFKLKKIVSLASLVATLSLPLINLALTSNVELSSILLIIACLIIYKHRENIKRIVKGEEKGFKAAAS